MTTNTGPHRATSALAGGDARPDAALRLRQFRESHPGIEIRWRRPWEAAMPEAGGARRWVLRWELHDLLDEVERRLAEQAACDDSREAGHDRA